MLDKLIEIFLQFAELFRIYTLVDEYEEAVILRLGKYHRTAVAGKINWMWPLKYEDYHAINIVTKTQRTANQILTTKDGKTCSVSITVRWRVRDSRKALLEVDDIRDAFADITVSQVAAAIRSHTWEEILSEDFADSIYKEARSRGFKYGIEVEQLALTDIALGKNLILTENK